MARRRADVAQRSLDELLQHPASTPIPEALRPAVAPPLERPETLPVTGGRRVRRRESGYSASVRPFTRLQGEERIQAALPVLTRALELLQERGWCQGAIEDDTGRLSLPGALMMAGDGRLECEFAREVLRHQLFDWDLPAWNDHPARRKADVIRELRRAIARAGGHVRRGGWTVSR